MDDKLIIKLLGLYALDEDISFQQVFTDGSLESEILFQMTNLTEHMLDISDRFEIDESIPALRPYKTAASDYNSFPIGQILESTKAYKQQINVLNKNIDEIHQKVKFRYKSLRDDMIDELKYFTRAGFRISPGDNIETFERKNKYNPKRHLLKEIHLDLLASTNLRINLLDKKYSEASDECNAAKDRLRQGNSTIHNIEAALDLINELAITATDKEKTETDKILTSLIRGEIKNSTARKNIYKKPEIAVVKPTEPKFTPEKSIETIFDENEEINKEDLDFLSVRGIKTSLAKDIFTRKNYADIKEFITTIESIFDRNGINIKEAQVIYQKHPGILIKDTKELLEYTQMIDNLYDIHNPKVATGILPRYNPQLYASSNTIKEYILSKSENATEVSIVGLEKITNANNKKVLEDKLKISPFCGSPIKKFIHKIGGARTPMYEAYSAIGGDGHYRKMKFGRYKRAVLKITNDSNGSYTAKVIEYFDTHNKHMDFFN